MLIIFLLHPLDAAIPIASESGVRIEVDKWPKLRNLDDWLKFNPRHTVDINGLLILYPNVYPSDLLGTTKKKDITSKENLTSIPKMVPSATKQESSSKPDSSQKIIAPSPSQSTDNTQHKPKKSAPVNTSASNLASTSSAAFGNDPFSFLTSAAAISQFLSRKIFEKLSHNIVEYLHLHRCIFSANVRVASNADASSTSCDHNHID